MKRFAILFLIALIGILAACSSQTTYHKTALPDPKSFAAHFGDMDTSGNGLVNWDEFKAYFPQAEKKIFQAVDLNTDNALDHDEWHAFKEAHGMKDH
jgi:hypothetical protein